MVKNIIALVKISLSMIRPPIACNPENATIIEPFGNPCRSITRVKANGPHIKGEPPLAVQPFKIRNTVMDAGGRGMYQ